MKCDGLTVFAIFLVIAAVALVKPTHKDNRAASTGFVPCMEVADKDGAN